MYDHFDYIYVHVRILDIPLTPTVTDILSQDSNITLKWVHDTKCFEGSIFQYVVTWESAIGEHSLKVQTQKRSVTVQTIPRQTYAVELKAIASNGLTKQRSKNVFLQVTAGKYHCLLVSVSFQYLIALKACP